MTERLLEERLIILDRDGVINEDSDAYIKSLDEWHPLPGSLDAIARLTHAGYRIAIATNQSGIGRGLLNWSDLLAIHRSLRDLLAERGARIELIAVCPHLPEADCPCRKPRPGLLLDIASRLRIDLKQCPVIGDSFRDVQAARSVGAAPWLVRTGKGERTLLAHSKELGGVPVVRDLAEAVEHLLRRDHSRP